MSADAKQELEAVRLGEKTAEASTNFKENERLQVWTLSCCCVNLLTDMFVVEYLSHNDVGITLHYTRVS